MYVLRLMGAVHRLVLSGEAPALAPHFGPVMGSLSFASTRISTGEWLFLMKLSV